MPGSNPCTRLGGIDSDELALVLDGAASEETLDHLASCDDCRDARHEAEHALALVRRAGADYVHRSDLVDRLMASLDERASIAHARPSETSGATREGEPSVEPSLEPSVATNASAPNATAGVLRSNEPSTQKRAWPRWPLFAAFAAAAAIAVVIARPPLHTTSTAFHGQVVEIVRASKDPVGGLEVCAPSGVGCHLAKNGENVGEGARIKSDPRTRARITLSDGCAIVLDRDTEIELTPRAPRTARIVRGIVFADVAHLEDPKADHARFVLPHGTAEVLGTKLTLTATSDMSLVEVSRGEVALHAGDRVTSVRAGSEGRVLAGRPPIVSPSGIGADGGDWAELSPKNDLSSKDAPPRGLGELRAKKPGETRERERAVRLARHHVDVRIAGNVARTEIDETFANDSSEELEGIYRMPLPPDAQIEKLALEVGGKLEAGAFVERTRAKAIWGGVIQHAAPAEKQLADEIVWVPGPWKDPALLEWQRGGRFELRIFPIPAKGARRVVLAYTQTLPRSGTARRYTYPLAYDEAAASSIDDFSVDVRVMGHDASFGVKSRGYALARGAADEPLAERWSMHARGFVPAGDLALEYALPNDESELTIWTRAGALGEGKVREDGYVALALRPRLPDSLEGRDRFHAIVVDASRSMFGERWSRTTQVVSTFVRDLDRRDRFVVVACDTECRPVGGEARDGGGAAAEEIRRALAAIEPRGAHDPVAALRAALARAKSANDGKKLHLLYVGDGSATAGTSKPDRVAKVVAADVAAAKASVTAVAIGADADRDLLAAVARGGGGAFVRDSGKSAEALAVSALATMRGAVLEHPSLRLPPGLRAVVPQAIDSIPAGEEALVLARVEPGIDAIRGTIELEGEAFGEKVHRAFAVDVPVSSASGNAFLPRLYAAARIGELERSRGDQAKDEIVRLSRENSVASRYTSLLVLESEAMFRAYGVERKNDVTAWTGDTLAESVAVDAHSPEVTSAEADVERRGARPAYRFPNDPISFEDSDLYVPMRRTWVRRGSFSTEVSGGDAALTVAESAWANEPESRTKTAAFVRALAGAGRIERASERVRAWLERDPRDLGALAVAADLASREGDRAKALRLLGSVVDLRPDDASAQLRLARAFEAIADGRACGHRIAVAENDPKDADNFVRTIRCAQASGLGLVADDLLRDASNEIRRRLGSPPRAATTRREIALDASWEGGADLDVALVDAEGKRYGWLGGPAGTVDVDGAASTSHELLGLAGIPPGTYTLEIGRSLDSSAKDSNAKDSEHRTSAEARGVVVADVFGKKTRVPFTLSTPRAVLGQVTVRREQQLVPIRQ